MSEKTERPNLKHKPLSEIENDYGPIFRSYITLTPDELEQIRLLDEAGKYEESAELVRRFAKAHRDAGEAVMIL